MLDLTSGVGNGQDNRPQDVFGFDSALRRADETYRPAAPYDRAPASLVHGSLVDGIERWQERKGIRTDGFALPGGETQHSLNNTLLRKPAGAGLWRWETPLFKDIVGSGWANRYDDVRSAKRLFGATGWMKESPFDDPSPILDESLHDAIGAFQRRRGLKETHRIEPGDDTDAALRADAAGLARQATPAWRDFWRRHDASGLWTRGPGGEPESGFALAKWDRQYGFLPRDPLESSPGGPGMFGGATGGSMRRAPRPPAPLSPPSRPESVEEALKSLGPTFLPLGIAYETIRRILGQEDKPQTEVEQLIPEVPPEAGKPNVGPDPSRPPPPLATPGYPAESPPAPRREEYPISEPKKGEGVLITPDERDELRQSALDRLESRHGSVDNRKHIAGAVNRFVDMAEKLMPGSVKQTHGPRMEQLYGYHERYYPPANQPSDGKKITRDGSFSDADGVIEYRGVTIRWVYNLYSTNTDSTDANEREMEQLRKFRLNASKAAELGIVINDWKRPKGAKIDFTRFQAEVRKVLEEIKKRIDAGELKPGGSFVREIWLNKR